MVSDRLSEAGLARTWHGPRGREAVQMSGTSVKCASGGVFERQLRLSGLTTDIIGARAVRCQSKRREVVSICTPK